MANTKKKKTTEEKLMDAIYGPKDKESIGFVVVYSTGSDLEASWRGQSGEPVVHLSKKAATIAMVEDFIDTLLNQLEEVKKGDRDFDDIDQDFDEYVEEVIIKADGSIVTKYPPHYNLYQP